MNAGGVTLDVVLGAVDGDGHRTVMHRCGRSVRGAFGCRDISCNSVRGAGRRSLIWGGEQKCQRCTDVGVLLAVVGVRHLGDVRRWAMTYSRNAAGVEPR